MCYLDNRPVAPVMLFCTEKHLLGKLPGLL